MSDSVNHPKHYTAYKGLEIIDLTEQMNFNRGNAVKYVARAGLKNPVTEIEDLEKAVWYIQREIQRIKKEDLEEEIKPNPRGYFADINLDLTPVVRKNCLATIDIAGHVYTCGSLEGHREETGHRCYDCGGTWRHGRLLSFGSISVCGSTKQGLNHRHVCIYGPEHKLIHKCVFCGQEFC